VVEYLNKSLLQIYHLVCQRENFKNRLTFGEVMGKSLVSCFLTHDVVAMTITIGDANGSLQIVIHFTRLSVDTEHSVTK